MITIHFPKYLQELTDGVESQKIDTTDVATLIEGLRILFPKLSLFLSNIESQNVRNICFFMDKEKKEIITFALSRELKCTEIVLLVTIYGQGEDVTQILIGTALIAASFIPGLQGITIPLIGSSLTGAMFSFGLNMVLGGFLAMLSPQEVSAPAAAPDAPIRSQNDSFGPLQNTTSTDMAVPLVFGLMRVPGQFVGGRVRTINHDAYTVVSVANYV